MLCESTQKRTNLRIKIIQSSTDKAIPIARQDYAEFTAPSPEIPLALSFVRWNLNQEHVRSRPWWILAHIKISFQGKIKKIVSWQLSNYKKQLLGNELDVLF